MLEYQEITTRTLERFMFAIQKEFTEQFAHNCIVDSWIEHESKNMVIRISRDILGKKLDTIKYPQNWKEAVKEAFFNWLEDKFDNRYKVKHNIHIKITTVLAKTWAKLNKKYPVKYKIYNAVMYYPDMVIPNQRGVFNFVEVK
ncbi:MAG: hypothetical protein PHQ35_09400 [Phycisphaerae bacterium]|nr:hypothetical protein [Phycisphaerae bacterium]MDD5239932.1 hypothetical protein [Candidatus Nanoarchaeia archaeon]